MTSHCPPAACMSRTSRRRSRWRLPSRCSASARHSSWPRSCHPRPGRDRSRSAPASRSSSQSRSRHRRPPPSRRIWAARIVISRSCSSIRGSSSPSRSCRSSSWRSRSSRSSSPAPPWPPTDPTSAALVAAAPAIFVALRYPHVPPLAPQRDRMTAALTADRLAKTYDELVALDDFTASLHAGQLVALVGHNGSGKSTFLRLAAGLLEPTDGEVAVQACRGRVARRPGRTLVHPRRTGAVRRPERQRAHRVHRPAPR